MEKIKNAISKALAWLNKAYQWLNKEGGMLHILACYAMMLTFAPFGYGWASAITWAVAIAKEICDIARKRNTLQQTINDIIRDAIGWGCASLVWLITM
jgi:hypothetical protein